MPVEGPWGALAPTSPGAAVKWQWRPAGDLLHAASPITITPARHCGSTSHYSTTRSAPSAARHRGAIPAGHSAHRALAGQAAALVTDRRQPLDDGILGHSHVMKQPLNDPESS